MRRGVLIWTALGAGAITIAVVARAASSRGEERGRGGPLAKVARQDLATVVKATGVVKPMIGAQVRVGSRASGVVKRLFVRVGDNVAKGQVLAELDTGELSARRGQAAAVLASSEADLRYAEVDLGRKRELRNAQLLAPSELDLAERALAVAEQRKSEARSSLEYAATQLGYARILAPITGIVSSVSTQEGETVAASLSAPTFVTLLDLSRLEVWAYVDETDIGRVRVGQPARFTVDTYPGQEFPGRVTAIYPEAEIRDNVVNYVCVVRFDPPRDRTLRPEMTATVTIAVETRTHVLAVPRRAVQREGGRTFVVVRHGAVDERRVVTTGSRDETWCEIADGLAEGEEVLLPEAKAS